MERLKSIQSVEQPCLQENKPAGVFNDGTIYKTKKLAATALIFTELIAGCKVEPTSEPISGGDIPSEYLQLYRDAADLYGIKWKYIAAIGKIESDHGRSNLPGVKDGVNTYGCCAGPMQFNITNGPPSTWDEYGGDYNNDGDINVYDPGDAIYAAANMLEQDGINRSVEKALRRYNNSAQYVRDVKKWAQKYSVKYGS